MSSTLALSILRFLLIIPAIILHEVSHGYVALLLGDPTARDRGRLTLNPVAHVDIWGTLIMPAMLLLASGGRFAMGYAKPVPIDPRRMYRVKYQLGMLLTGAAGPVTNIVLAAFSAMVFRVLLLLPTVPEIVVYIFAYFTFINLVLAFFNLIPIPPLDGSRVIQYFLKGQALRTYAELERYGFTIVLVLVFVLPYVTKIDVIGAYFDYTVRPIANLLLGGPVF
jgi:Zn-dependent protease